ncbi:hypothetical protein [Paracoccus ravus]|uniref:hypothetical protein n=1 Tax=Paracoccus ravus TaxID=2447760 RepID=UPI00106EAB6E|nr:hypothetical protein [Paracoccus ravus]
MGRHPSPHFTWTADEWIAHWRANQWDYNRAPAQLHRDVAACIAARTEDRVTLYYAFARLAAAIAALGALEIRNRATFGLPVSDDDRRNMLAWASDILARPNPDAADLWCNTSTEKGRIGRFR